MIPMNEAYGNAASLREYCGANKLAPIWGEIQHSLWLNNLNKKNEHRSRLFPKLFTWNSLLDYENSIPIGDPMSYFLKLKPPDLNKNKQHVVLLPKFRRAASLDVRILEYRNFMTEAMEKLTNSHFIISIHPEELKHRDRIFVGDFSKISIHDTTEITNPMDEYVSLFENASLLYTDYLGAHVFRAKSYFNLKTDLALKTWENPLIDDRIRKCFADFVETQEDSESKAISDLLLGLNHMRSPEELSKLLGLTKARSFVGRLIRRPYIDYSQRLLK